MKAHTAVSLRCKVDILLFTTLHARNFRRRYIWMIKSSTDKDRLCNIMVWKASLCIMIVICTSRAFRLSSRHCNINTALLFILLVQTSKMTSPDDEVLALQRLHLLLTSKVIIPKKYFQVGRTGARMILLHTFAV